MIRVFGKGWIGKLGGGFCLYELSICEDVYG